MDILLRNRVQYSLVSKWSRFPGGSDSKASVYNAEDPGSSPGLGRSPGEGNSSPLQYYCLENPMDRGAWKAIVYGVSKSRTRLSNFTTSLSEVTQLCLTLCDPMNCSPTGSSVRGISQAENWSGLPFLLQGLFLTQRWNPHLPNYRQILYHWATWEHLIIKHCCLYSYTIN